MHDWAGWNSGDYYMDSWMHDDDLGIKYKPPTPHLAFMDHHGWKWIINDRYTKLYVAQCMGIDDYDDIDESDGFIFIYLKLDLQNYKNKNYLVQMIRNKMADHIAEILETYCDGMDLPIDELQNKWPQFKTTINDIDGDDDNVDVDVDFALDVDRLCPWVNDWCVY